MKDDDKKKDGATPETKTVEVSGDELLGKLDALIEKRTAQMLEDQDKRTEERLKPIIESIKTQDERVIEGEKRKARLTGATFVDLGDETDLDEIGKKLAAEGKSFHDPVPQGQFSFVRGFRLMMGEVDEKAAPYEARAFVEGQKKALAMGTDSAGGYLVPTVMMPEEFIELYTAQSVALKAGVRRYPNLVGGRVDVPKKATNPSVAWLGENESISEGSLTFGQLALTPHMCAAYVAMSRSLIRNSALAAEQIVRESLAASIARGLDLAIFRGTGTSNQPTGIANTSNINTEAIGTNGGAFTPIIAKKMRAELTTDNIPEENLAWVMHSRTWENLDRQLVASEANNFALVRNILEGTPKRLLGWPVFISNQLPTTVTKGINSDCSEVYLGKVDEAVLGEWGGVEIEATREGGNSFLKHQVLVKVVVSVDVGVSTPAAWCLCNDARDI